jgi:hypothetical protein
LPVNRGKAKKKSKKCQVTGRNAHDARLVAAMTVHVVTHLLTVNTADFARYLGVTALEPAAISP